MKLFLISVAIKLLLIAVVLGVLFFVFQTQIEKRVHNRLEVAVKIERLKEDREWKRLTRRQAAELRLVTPRDGVDRSHGWHWHTKDHEYRLVKGLLAGDIAGDVEEPVLTGEFEEAFSE